METAEGICPSNSTKLRRCCSSAELDLRECLHHAASGLLSHVVLAKVPSGNAASDGTESRKADKH